MNKLRQAAGTIKLASKSVGKAKVAAKSQRKKRMGLGEEISAGQMDNLKNIFFEADSDGNGSLDIEEFLSAMGPFFGTDTSEEKLTLLFRRMDSNLNGEVDWDEFSDFMLLESSSGMEEETKGNAYQIGCITHDQFNHYSSINHVAYSEDQKRYFTSSLDGTIRVWNAKQSNPTHLRTIFNNDGWINDMILLRSAGDHELLAVATSNSIRFYDVATLDRVGDSVYTTVKPTGRDPQEKLAKMSLVDLNELRFKVGTMPNNEVKLELEKAIKARIAAVRDSKPGESGEEKLKTFPLCLHYWRDDSTTDLDGTVVGDILAVGDDAGQVTIFRPPDPADMAPEATLIGLVDHHASKWSNEQVLAWATELKLGDELIGAFRKFETKGSELVRLEPAAKLMFPMSYPSGVDGPERLQAKHLAAVLTRDPAGSQSGDREPGAYGEYRVHIDSHSMRLPLAPFAKETAKV